MIGMKSTSFENEKDSDGLVISSILLDGAERKVCLICGFVVSYVVVNTMNFRRNLVKTVAQKMRQVHSFCRSRCPHDRVAYKTRLRIRIWLIDENPKI